MNNSQRKILIRLGIFSVILLLGYVALILYLTQNIAEEYTVFTIFTVSFLYISILTGLWLREKNLYHDYVMSRRIASGQIEYMLCPSCKSIQRQGKRKCLTCGEIWISCKVCRIPFEPGSKVLVSPCCGEGFHVEHFEVALRELAHCPYCKSDLALKTSNW